MKKNEILIKIKETVRCNGVELDTEDQVKEVFEVVFGDFFSTWERIFGSTLSDEKFNTYINDKEAIISRGVLLFLEALKKGWEVRYVPQDNSNPCEIFPAYVIFHAGEKEVQIDHFFKPCYDYVSGVWYNEEVEEEYIEVTLKNNLDVVRFEHLGYYDVVGFNRNYNGTYRSILKNEVTVTRKF